MKSTFIEEMSPAIEWNELARKICKRNEENKLVDKEVLDDIVDDDEEEYDDDSNDSSDENQEENAEMIPVDPKEKESTTKKPTKSTNAPKSKSTIKPKTTTSVPPSIIDSNNENDESEADDDYDYSEEDDDEDQEDERITTEEKSKDALLDRINVIKEVVDKTIFGNILT